MAAPAPSPPPQNQCHLIPHPRRRAPLPGTGLAAAAMSAVFEVTTTASVIVPEQAHALDVVRITAPDGTLCNVMVPAGAKPYSTFSAEIPTTDECAGAELVPTIEAHTLPPSQLAEACRNW
eukprot:SAG31_NODE_11841_length_993_cov_1.275168_1_plen_121_part_00